MEFDTLNWDDFWQKKLQASLNERTQTALDGFEVTSAQHRVHAERLLTHLQESFPDVEFAAENMIGSWGIYARSNKQRKLPDSKMDKVKSAADGILENIEEKYPLETLPQQIRPIESVRSEPNRKGSKSGCLGVLIWFGLLMGLAAVVLI
jgi:hypothetical protein